MDCIVSIDGLGIGDLADLSKHLPLFGSWLEQSATVSIKSRCFTNAQPIWAELLTGERWYANGCVGYSRPEGSLDKLAVFTERDLLKPACLLRAAEETSAVASINVPLIQPRGKNLTWLSDGSLPTNRVVSPSDLAETDLFKNYRARPYTDIGAALAGTHVSSEQCLTVEKNRLDCVNHLVRSKKFSRIIWRITLFDQLAHLHGLDFLKTDDLQGLSGLPAFLAELDRELAYLASDRNNRLFILSAYSHMPCRARLNLNELFEQSGFLNLEGVDTQAERSESLRLRAAAALLGREPAHSTLRSMEGRLALSSTTVASPISGCIYINSKMQFSDGSVTSNQYERVREEVKAFLQKRLGLRFGGSYIWEENPSKSPVDGMVLPEFIVRLPYVELHNMQETGASWYDVPRSTHSPEGFVCLPRHLASTDSIGPEQFVNLLAD